MELGTENGFRPIEPCVARHVKDLARSTSMKSRSIKLYLCHGEPSGIRTAQIMMSPIISIAFKRHQLDEVRERFPDVDKPGVYILIGTEDRRHIAYIGESEKVAERMKDHERNKEFWTDAVVLTSTNQNFTKSHVRFAESLLIRESINDLRWDVPNHQKPSAKAGKLPPFDEDPMREFVEQAKVLVGALGWDLFRDTPDAENNTHFSFAKENAYEAVMIVDSKGSFYVQRGSKANVEESKGASTTVREHRKALLDSGALVQNDKYLIFESDYRFNSPSAAASVVAGYGRNGKTSWKINGNTTFKEWEKQNKKE